MTLLQFINKITIALLTHLLRNCNFLETPPDRNSDDSILAQCDMEGISCPGTHIYSSVHVGSMISGKSERR